MLILSASLFSRKSKKYKKSQSKRDFIETTASFSKNSINKELSLKPNKNP